VEHAAQCFRRAVANGGGHAFQARGTVAAKHIARRAKERSPGARSLEAPSLEARTVRAGDRLGDGMRLSLSGLGAPRGGRPWGNETRG
jgi:hypothetical protein